MNTIAIKRNQNINLKRQTVKSVNVKLLGLVLVAIFFGLLYVSKVTNADMLNYELSEAQTTFNQLTEENEWYSIEAARLKSLETIKQNPLIDELVSVNSPVYLENN